MYFVGLFYPAVFHFGENIDLLVAGSIILKEYFYVLYFCLNIKFRLVALGGGDTSHYDHCL